MAKNSFRVAQSLTLAPQASAPTSPVNGDVYYDSGLGLFQIRQGGAWLTPATLTGTEVLTNKTLTAPTINGGTATALTGLSLRDTSAAFNVTLAATSSTALTAGRTLTLDMVNAARSVKLQGNLDIGGNLTTGGTVSTTGTFSSGGNFSTSSTVSITGAFSTAAAFTTSGANALTLTATAPTNATLPSGTQTLAMLAAQTFTGLQTFTAGALMDDDTANGGKTSLNYYREDSLGSITFTMNGSGNSNSGTVLATRVGNVVTLQFPSVVTSANGTTDNVFLSSTNALPVWATPTVTSYFRVLARSGGNGSVNGLVELHATNRTIQFFLIGGALFLAGSSGLEAPTYVTYRV